MKIPKQLVIKGQTYKIVLCQTTKEFLKHKDADKEDLGFCDKMDKEIWLNGAEHAKYKTGEQRLMETLWHEIGHAIMEETGISYGIADVLEEVIVDTFSKEIVRLKGKL